MKRIYIIVGSIRPHWLGQRVAQWVRINAKQQTDATVTIVAAEDIALTEADHLDSNGKRKKYDLANADGYILVAPEYESGKEGVLNNVVSALKQEVTQKPVAFVSYGLNGGYKLVDRLRSKVRGVNLAPLRNSVHIEEPWDVIDQSGELHNDTHDKSLQSLLKQMRQWIAIQSTR